MMKRNVWLAAAACGLLLAGCSGGEGPVPQSSAQEAQNTEAAGDSGQAAAESEGKVTISVWTTNRHDQEYMTEQVNKFNEENDHIYIDYQVYSDNYSQMLDLAFSTDTAPEIFQVSDFALSYEKGQMMDLTGYLTDEYMARFNDGSFFEGVNMYDGKIYSLPYTASAARLFYNKDIFDRVGIEAPPETIEEMVADAKLITEQLAGEGIYGFAGNFKSASSCITRSVDQIVQRSGGTLYGYDFKNGVYDFSSYKPVLEAFRDIFANGYGFPGSESLDIDPLRTQFAAGNIGMYISVSHAEPGVYTTQFPTDVNWDCAQLPTVNGTVEGKQKLWFGGNNWAINSNAQHPDEAWEVMEFFHSDEVMGPYYTLGLGTVMIKTAIADVEPPETIEKMPNLAINEDDQNWPPLPLGVSIEGKDYSTVCVECIFGITDVDDAIADLNARYNDAYDKTLENGGERIIYPNFDSYTMNLD